MSPVVDLYNTTSPRPFIFFFFLAARVTRGMVDQQQSEKRDATSTLSRNAGFNQSVDETSASLGRSSLVGLLLFQLQSSNYETSVSLGRSSFVGLLLFQLQSSDNETSVSLGRSSFVGLSLFQLQSSNKDPRVSLGRRRVI